jgi:hypothetical protein
MRSMFCAMIAVGVFGLGCHVVGNDDMVGEEPRAESVSGTRLKRRLLTSKDGACQQIGWFDVDRGETCSFRKVEWNESRCIPDETVIETKNAQAHALLYTDSSCSNEVVHLGPPSAFDCTQGLVAKYVVDDRTISCKDIDFKVFQIGDRLSEQVADVSVRLYELVDGECADVGEKAREEFALLTEVPIDSFAEGGERIE